MPLHFDAAELAERRRKACDRMAARGLDGMLIFRQESLYYLTGYDTFGYVYFQCLYLGADGTMILLTRAPDQRQALFTSVIEDVRVWVDEAGATPEAQLLKILEEKGCRGRKLGVEWHAYGLTAQLGFRLREALDGFCAAEDSSDLVSRLRLVKSPKELEYARRAGELADAAYDEAMRLAGPGVFEGDILAAMQAAVFEGGGDDPANETIIGSGPGALMCRYFTGRRHLSAEDQLTLEFAGVYRHYHACLMRTIRIGAPPPRQVAMHEAAVDSLVAAKEALRPGRPIGEVFDAHAAVLDKAGLRAHRMNACGYSLGATYAPNWMDWPMFFHGNPEEAAPGMVFFIHIIVFDSDSGLAMTSGQTVEVTEDGCRPTTNAPLDFVVK
ncbi:Xaa-Pro peptidase family protein [Inquilinus sp. CAU 1745]|uniref:M24 family metallopeptidase n=1 Tax=Inquilinus sp. CAU 1745 TaxID=3140369 RepID=UPI00325B84E5